MAPKLGYWNIRGLAQPIRLLLEEAGVEYEEKRYNYGPPPTFDRSEWNNEKFNLGLPLPNLPYYIDGDIKITQSLAIMRHIARTNNLVGKTEEEQVRADMAEQQLVDFRSAFVPMCYNPNFETLKVDYLANLEGKLKVFSDLLGTNPYFAGPNVTYVDFLIYEMLDQHKYLDPNVLDKFANLKEFHARIEERPRIAAYLKSDKYLKWPLNGDMAAFGSRHKPLN